MSVPVNHETAGMKRRAVSLDLARGATLLLIVLAHAPLYLYMAEPGIMHRVESGNSFDHIVNLFGMFIIDNRARAMFAVLLGYGLVLAFRNQVAKGKSDKEAAKTIRRRSLYLIGFGAILLIFIGGQDILVAYGVAGLLVSWLLSREIKTLIRTFIIVTLFFIILTPTLWGFFLQANGDYGFATSISSTDTYLNSMITKLITFPFIPVMIHFMLPILPSVLLGMWMARYQVLTKPEQPLKSLYFIAIPGLAISLLGAVPLSLIGNVWHPSYFTAGLASGLHMITGIVGGLAYTAIFGIIGAKLKKSGRLSLSFIALGKRSLTFYVWNETLLVLFLSPVALDLGGHVGNGAAAVIAVGIWVFSILVASILEKKNWNGPLEILLRRLVTKSEKNERQ
ncbi:DUF418 domain-containing protein [Paenibacillus sp. GCM10027627]|uniref:DUF418 domain-containing protein n=1 Tax=unclassified Paenibacillus TaxID=185978 RepID=UPI00363AE28F